MNAGGPERPATERAAWKAENLNYLWADLLLEELVRQARGTPLVILCPGSRSSPLSIAASRTLAPCETMVVADERCAGFIALGAAAVGREPIVITTSGTAVANLLPAVVEASASARSIIVLSADRPRELHECGANQTIPQLGIFGAFTRWTFELPLPDSSVDPAFVLSTADEARHRARSPLPGPVHLNVPFREPLAPRAVTYAQPTDPRLLDWAERPERVWRTLASVMKPAIPAEAVDASGLREAERGVIVAGVGSDADAVAGLARAIGWPVLADIGSGLRVARHRDVVAAVPDLVLAAIAGAETGWMPDCVLRVGGHVSSKRLNAIVSASPRTVVVRDGLTRFDESHRAHAELVGDLRSIDPAGFRASALAERWLRSGAIAERAIDAAHASGTNAAPLTEPWIARELLKALPPNRAVVLGNSMPIRDADMHAPGTLADRRIVTSRGASGIDGLVSTAVGVASLGQPTTLLVGDLSLLHDLGGLANLRRVAAQIDIVVVNNDGGGIFHFLPVAGEPSAAPTFERLFGTPHGFGFEHAAAMFSLDYRKATTRGQAIAAFAAGLDARGPRIVECVTSRATNVADHRALQAAVREALASEFGR